MGDASEQPPHGLSSVYEEYLRVPDFRRAQGRKHTIASVFAINTVASLVGFESGIAVAQFARALNQTQLKMLGAWFNPKTKKYEPPSKSVIYRVREKADPAAMETVLKRWSMPRLNSGSALAADGKRLRGANRNGDGHFETATLVAHDTGLPVASHGFHDESGERAALAALFEEVSLAGHVITVRTCYHGRRAAHSRRYRPQHRRNPQRSLPDDGEGECTGNLRNAQHDRLEPRCDRGVRGRTNQRTWTN